MSLIMKINLDDWHDETLKEEIMIRNEADLIELIEKGFHTGKVGRMVIVSRELGETEDDILSTNKILLNAAAQNNISRLVVKHKHIVETKTGEKYEAHDYIGAIREGEESSEISYVSYQDKEARQRIEHYLFSIVTGHIWNRLLLLSDNGGDAKRAADQLKILIDDMVVKLS